MAYEKQNFIDSQTLKAEHLNHIEDGIANIVNIVYPVGSIYMSINSVSPDTLFGGTWEQLKDRFLLAAGDSYEVGSTGGEETHTLTVNEMPSHNHAFTDTGRMLMWDSNCSPLYDPSSYNGTDGNIQTTWNTMTAYSGGGAAHNNMPPYLTVYMWRRTA